jgi:GNAT superfamily N-acetyltransferase
MSAIKLAQSDAEILATFPLMRELRPHLTDPGDFLVRARRQQDQAGWRLAYIEADGAPVACAGFRVSEFLAWGRTLYVDDLFTRQDQRDRGHGELLLRWLMDVARREGCAQFHLDSGTQRLAAHRLYHRMKLAITSFHFGRTL